MTKDQMAYEEWADINNSASDYLHPYSAWEAACAYNQKRINELQTLITNNNIICDTDKAGLQKRIEELEEEIKDRAETEASLVKQLMKSYDRPIKAMVDMRNEVRKMRDSLKEAAYHINRLLARLKQLGSHTPERVNAEAFLNEQEVSDE